MGRRADEVVLAAVVVRTTPLIRNTKNPNPNPTPTPNQVVFVDDNPANCAAARALGIDAIHFESAAALRPELQRAGVLPR